ncbi:MAG: alanine racemase [Acidobacteria bacterium]|nr:alanine racemase [Acidobacteriota bacterium]
MSRPTWAEVSLSALRHNFGLIRDFVAPHATVCAVVKCDAYGHGAVPCAQSLEEAGAKWLGVTSTEEGVELRRAGMRARILLMSGMWQGEGEAVVEHNLTPAVWSAEHLAELNRAAEKLGKKAFPVHLEVDTGMARQGVPLSGLPKLLEATRRAKSLCLEGMHSHLASAEVVDAADVQEQLAAYERALAQLAADGVRPACLHIANSAGLVAHMRSWRFSSQIGNVPEVLVRPGICLYGYFLPFVSGSGDPVRELPVTPVLSWKTRIIDLRKVAAGQGTGYSRAYVTKAPATIATLAVGYGDGLSRRLSSRGRVLLRGEFAPIVGNVSMDVTTIDVSTIAGAEVGDEVVLIGEQAGRRLTACDMARLTGSIPYEVLCNVSKRVPRQYS